MPFPAHHDHMWSAPVSSIDRCHICVSPLGFAPVLHTEGPSSCPVKPTQAAKASERVGEHRDAVQAGRQVELAGSRLVSRLLVARQLGKG